MQWLAFQLSKSAVRKGTQYIHILLYAATDDQHVMFHDFMNRNSFHYEDLNIEFFWFFLCISSMCF